MKAAVALALLLLVALGVLLYKEPERVRHWFRDSGLVETPEVTRVYRWQDAQGRWHITDTRPPAGTPFTVQSYRSDENIVPLPPQLQKREE